MDFHHARQPVVEKFSPALFVLTVAASLAGLTGIFWLVAPDVMWKAQWQAAWWQFAVVFVSIKLFNCGVEFFFHRYVLHKPVVPLLGRFYRQHTLHHSLTRITRKRLAGGREIPFVENIYPMTEPEQGEAAFFPWYTLAVFAVLVTPLFVLLQWLAPSFPWFFGGYAALAGSLILYELFHAVEHWPLSTWMPLLEHPRWGRGWTKIYSFHLRHHAVIDCNEAISGFFTFPLADMLAGTWVSPKTLYADGGEWEAAEFKSPRPRAFIRWCDRTADRIVAFRRARARRGRPVLAHPVSRHEKAGLKKL